MSHSFTLIPILAALTFVGCSKRQQSDADIPPNVREALRDVARQQSAGFTNGTCTIRQAYRYTGALPLPKRGTNAFLALIIEVTGYGENFDFDDIDLIDADSGENLGSDPGLWLLKADGTADTGSTEWPAAPGPITVFLLYERARLPKRIKLGYWGSEIVKQPVDVSADGKDMFKAK